ncbi:Agenet-like domain-containing protein [Artemisia annua]|uniref:Agenet-like domain-containing protein n=1 Tax=Artemisia annua TaxID=35608 RepID=A0A2U1PTU8_ARTAN|nr:Agenet-like domain-containing protein [Artemisia annua]
MRYISTRSARSTVVVKEGKEEDAATVAPKRKRGRPPKLQPKRPQTPVTDIQGLIGFRWPSHILSRLCGGQDHRLNRGYKNVTDQRQSESKLPNALKLQFREDLLRSRLR